MTTLKLIRIEDPSLDSSAVDRKYQPLEIVMHPEESVVVLGRNNGRQRPDYCLESVLNPTMISRKHATLERTNGGFKIVDHSLNGTFVNCMRLVTMGGHPLKTGDVVTLGHMNGANIRQGEKVPPYITDLKYRVEIIEPSKQIPTANDSVLSSANSKTSAKLNSFPETSTGSANHDRKRLNPVTTSKSLKEVPSKSSKKRNESGGKLPEPSEKKKHSSSFMEHKSKPGETMATPVLTTFPESSGAGGVEGTDMYHYESDQCQAVNCKKPTDVNIDWIQCDKCESWYHQICVGITSASQVDEVDSYICKSCQRRKG